MLFGGSADRTRSAAAVAPTFSAAGGNSMNSSEVEAPTSCEADPSSIPYLTVGAPTLSMGVRVPMLTSMVLALTSCTWEPEETNLTTALAAML
jgi:hypothetical protein